MEDETSILFGFQDLEDDALSLCNLSSPPFISETYSGPSSPSPLKEDAFEFSNTCQSSGSVCHVDSILFCGKIIPFENPRYLLQRNFSFKRLRSSAGFESGEAHQLTRSDSLLFQSPKAAAPPPPAVGSFRYSSGSGGKLKALFGVTKFPARMDMDDIRKRQSRQAPAPLFPAGSDIALATSEGTGRSHWGLLRPLRCRSLLVSALARTSLGCIRHV
ncbi:hypothetical protein SAY86_024336 [Trapa natans]|uniref:Uncharacterized protein n=1 Tax=Trapa natans TaxID=22666 RepID=A0AAN7M4R9_TRANT|nr:hypothetical protein SAY86_024336 [Trapa natans]